MSKVEKIRVVNSWTTSSACYMAAMYVPPAPTSNGLKLSTPVPVTIVLM